MHSLRQHDESDQPEWKWKTRVRLDDFDDDDELGMERLEMGKDFQDSRDYSDFRSRWLSHYYCYY